MARVRGKGSSEFSIDRTVEDRVRLNRIADSNRPENKTLIGATPHFIGRHFYGYNFFSIDTETITYFEFTTTDKYLVGHMVGGRNMKSGAEGTVGIKVNGQQIFKTKWDNGASYTNNNPMGSVTPFIIPPYSNVNIYISTDAQDEISLGIMGEVYDA